MGDFAKLESDIKRLGLVGVNIYQTEDGWCCFTRKDGKGWTFGGPQPTLAKAVSSTLTAGKDVVTARGDEEDWKDLI